MTVIHKICGTKLITSADSRVYPKIIKNPGDFGYCLTCKKEVHHLKWCGKMKNGVPYPEFNPETEVIFD